VTTTVTYDGWRVTGADSHHDSMTITGSSLFSVARDQARQWWSRRDTDQRWLTTLATLLIASGLFHAVIWVLSGEPWAGPVSWRKPIIFGLSGGITTLSLAWVAGLLPRTAGRRVLTRLYVITMALEVGLITMQRWRGVGSHFNDATVFDAFVFNAMGLLIVTSSVTIVAWTIAIFRRSELRADVRVAAAAGLAILVGGLLVGAFISVRSNFIDAGATPSIVGQGGMAKLPHSIALHGLQVLPVLAFWLASSVGSLRLRVRALQLASFGYVLVFAAALAQMFAGLPPTQPTALTGLFASVGLVSLGIPFALALLGTRRRHTAAGQEVL
jgi:hypothetical protein